MKQINNEKAYQSNIFNACFFGSFMKNYKPLSILYLAFLLLAISNSAFAIDLRTYVPHTPGNQWSWVSNNYGTKTVTVGSPVTLPSGVVAIPSTIIDSSRNGSAISYSTIDANGLRKWQEYMSDVYIPNYGYTSGKIVYSPGLVIAPANVSIGSTYTSNGKATLTYTNISSFVLNYASSTKVVGFETVSNNSGTQSWSALKIINSVTFSGTVNGQFYTQSAVATSWLVDGLGNIKSYQPNDSQVMETWKLTDTNVTPVPIITSISPTSGTTLGDTAITITGTNLTGATSVKVNGVAATSVVVVSATSITAKTPAGTAGAKSLTVTTAGGTATKASGFTYVAAPTITSIAPTSGTTLGGTAFTIKGTNLTGATIVKVNGVAATSVVVVSATSITARTPAGTAGAKSVAVTTAGGTATKASAFTYVVPAPTITSIAPTSGTTLGGTAFTITGTNLTGATIVKVNGVTATSVVVVSATSITAKTPAGTVGAKSVAVTTAGGTATKASAFTYVVPAPTITSVTPALGTTAGGTSITINGTNFTGATSVKVNGVAAKIVEVDTATLIIAITPAGTAGAKSVAVTTAGGTATKAKAFTYVVPVPTITSISPDSGPTTGGTVVTVTGTNLTGVTVTVKGKKIPINSNTETSFKIKTPPSSPGYITVTLTTAYGSVTKVNAFGYYSPFTSDGTESSGSGTGGDGRATVSMTNGADASASQTTTNPAAETIVAAPMGVELYLQTIITQPDVDVDCVHTQSSDANAPDATTVTVTAIDLDHNGEADICQLRRGDLNLNGVVDDADMSILLHMIGTEPLHGIGDLDGNGVIDSADMSLLLLKVE